MVIFIANISNYDAGHSSSNIPKDNLSEDSRDKLFKDVMQNNWKEVVVAYEKNPDAHKWKLTKTEDTALHIAISNEKTTSFALKMLNALKKEDLLKNSKGNSPLHIAAMFGNLEVCKKIMEYFTTGNNHATLRNINGETPVFLAASHGMEEVFWYLYEKIDFAKEPLTRTSDGDTALHVAISGEDFGMAMDIINKQKNEKDKTTMVDAKNTDGLTPLHILASKPNAFLSSTPLGMFDRLIYYCAVPKADKSFNRKKHFGGSQRDTDLGYPRNYNTCMDFVKMLPVNKNSKIRGQCRTDEENQSSSDQGEKSVDGERLFPPNYVTMVLFFKFLMKCLLIVLGVGIRIVTLEETKRLHIQVICLLEEMVEYTESYKYYGNTGGTPQDRNQEGPKDIQKSTTDSQKEPGGEEKAMNGRDETSMLLIAAKTGVVEMVKLILKKFPGAIYDVDADEKNVVLVAVKNRQSHVYRFLLNLDIILKDTVFRHVDSEGYSALHMAAIHRSEYRPWLISSSALLMQWEVKWFQFVQDSMKHPNYFPRYNKNKQSASEVFLKTHEKLMQDGREWLTKTSESCLAMAAKRCFSTSGTVPGGLLQDKGTPVLGHKPGFHIFAIASLVAICFAVTTLLIFLSILNSRYQEKDFALDLPLKLHLGLTSLVVSIASMLVSFCAGHIFVLNSEFRAVAYPLYVVLFFPITYFALAQLNLYIDHIISIFLEVPQRGYVIY